MRSKPYIKQKEFQHAYAGTLLFLFLYKDNLLTYTCQAKRNAM